jgi:hypothetical protein
VGEGDFLGLKPEEVWGNSAKKRAKKANYMLLKESAACG